MPRNWTSWIAFIITVAAVLLGFLAFYNRVLVPFPRIYIYGFGLPSLRS